jgi:hypothetical protein
MNPVLLMAQTANNREPLTMKPVLLMAQTANERETGSRSEPFTLHR